MARRVAVRSPWVLLLALGPLEIALALGAGCSATGSPHPSTSGASSSSSGQGGHGGSASKASSTSSNASNGGGIGGSIFPIDGPTCSFRCSPDLHTVLDCGGNVIQQCSGTEGCDAVIGTCTNACQATATSKQSIGCEYYATDMDQFYQSTCFAAFVANTWNTPAHLQVEFAGDTLPVESFARIPSGAGPSLKYAPYDATAGLPPGEVAILFLAGTSTGFVPCPVPPATAMGGQIFHATDIGYSFHITADVPVVAYQMNPYGGGSATVTGASLLLPTSAWDRNYVVATASQYDVYGPSMNIIAAEDDTHVTMLPKVAVSGGGQLPAGMPNVPYSFTLSKGQQAQFSQIADLTGSVLQTSKPVGLMAGQPCMRVPLGVEYCDHGEQMVPPVRALGSEYVGVMFRPRVPGDQAIWRVIGAIDGTHLTYSSDVGGPATLAAGQKVEFTTDRPFQVKSQDSKHPFLLFTYMSGSQWSQLGDAGSYGDPDFVISVPPEQYLSRYVFFTDPTYPETNLVIVRARNGAQAFDDVNLDCAGALTGWQPVGDYEWTRIDLIRHDFVNQGNCSTGAHTIESKSPFGLWIWGWGSSETTLRTVNVSYGYPGGMNVQPINQVVISTMPIQ